MMSLDEFKSWFDEKFLLLLENKCAEFVRYSNSTEIKIILTHLMSIAREGKRVRPYMAYVGYTTEGGEHSVFELYAAIELLHLFCLMHDDVIDSAVRRHGVSTLNTLFDNATAMLIGDALLSWSFEYLLAAEEMEPYTIDDCKREYTGMLTEVIHGQLLDVLAMKNKVATKDTIETIVQLKSAHYSFYRPLVLGMLLAGAEDSIDFAKAYAVNIGMAFQLQDDLRDMEEDEKNGQRTLLTWYKQTHPDAGPKEIRHYARGLVEEYKEAARDAIMVYNKDVDSVWGDILDYFDIIER